MQARNRVTWDRFGPQRALIAKHIPQEKIVRASSKIITGKKDGTTQSDYGTFGRYVETPVNRMS
jgi:hypothetical protein